MRKFSFQNRVNGFWHGVSRGMEASVDVFEVKPQDFLMNPMAGLRLDKEALRQDVEKSRRKITGELERQRNFSRAG